MVQNIIRLSDKENRIVNMVKAKHGMKNKNQALGFIVQIYAKHFLPEALRSSERPQRSLERKYVDNLEALRRELKE
jgi:hypothetical protein